MDSQSAVDDDPAHDDSQSEASEQALIIEDPLATIDESSHNRTARLLYLSHFLSTWNSRAFEFGAFLFLAAIYPQTLLPASVYALSRAAAAAALAPWVGSYVDQGERLKVVRLSIVGQRIAVALSCGLLLVMLYFPFLAQSQIWAVIILVVLSILACVEKLSAMLNTIAIERDWVVVIADGNVERLRSLNSQMRRIDLFCKLMGPLAISFMDAASSRIAVLVTGAMTLISVGIEYLAIARVHAVVPNLAVRPRGGERAQQVVQSIAARFRATCSGSALYIRHPAFLPSFALALLYLTVLSFAGQMITYLVALGVKSWTIGLLRGVAAMVEMSATWLAPALMKHIGPVRAGIWFINWQVLCVTCAMVFFWLDFDTTWTLIGVVSTVVASRIGLWGFDLSVQLIVQEEVEDNHRGMFSSQECALQNIFEMLAFASTIIFARPKEFMFPATISAVAVGLSAFLYATFVRIRRGHLLHLSSCVDRSPKSHRHVGWLRVEDIGYDHIPLSENRIESQHNRSFS